MSARITWLSHACLEIRTGETTILIDPYLSGNPLAAASPEEVSPDYILVSHGHGDHLGDTIDIAKRTGATVVANHEIATWLRGQGLEKVHSMHIGGGHSFAFGRVELTIAHHGSSLPDGSYGGAPCGFLLTLEGKKLYHACDTGLFYDMKLIGEKGVDLAFLPIGDNFTMGPDDALRAVKLIEPKRAVPIHYDTFDLVAQDPKAWKALVEAQTGTEVIVLEPGGAVEM